MRRALLVFLVLFAASVDAASIDAVHLVWRTSDDGTPGTRDEWVTRAGQRRELIDHGRDQTLEVFDGAHGWRRDWNGFVAPLEGMDLKRQADFARLHMFGVTGPVDRVDLPSFDGKMNVVMSDFRDAGGGVEVPFTETRTSGPSESELHLVSVDLHPKALPSFARPEDGPNDTFFLRGQTSETIPFNFDNNHIMILATANGVGPLWWLVDTGADVAYINQSRIAELHMQPYGALQTIGGGEKSIGGSYVEHLTFRIGDIELRDQHASVLELKGIEKLYGMPMGGLLGYDFLSRFVVDIDYVHRTLTLGRRAQGAGRRWLPCSPADSGPSAALSQPAAQPPAPRALRSAPCVHVPLVLQGQQPYLNGSIRVGDETIPSWFILDVGAADTMTFTTPFIAAHKLLERAGDRERTVHHVAAPDVEAYAPTNVRGLVDGITLGSVTIPHVPVNLSVAKNGAYTSPAFDGNVGETLLARFPHVILDYGRREMVLVPGPDTTKPMQERTTFGWTLIASGDAFHTFTVTAVGATSPAARAGFKKGDVVAAIDGTPAAQLNLAAVKATVANAGAQHVFTVRRGDENVTLPVTVELVPRSGLR
jgi:hypothetical protein